MIAEGLVPALVSLANTITAVAREPVRVSLEPVTLQIHGGGLSGMPSGALAVDRHGLAEGSPRPPKPGTGASGSPGQDEISFTRAQRARLSGLIDDELAEAMLDAMGSRKWRPDELLGRIMDSWQGHKEGIVPETVREVLVQLSKEGKVVQLPTRFMRADNFDVASEIKELDVEILRLLDLKGPMVAKEIAESLSRSGHSRPSTYNHLRVLRTPPWGLVRRDEAASRGTHAITAHGKQLLAALEEQG